MPMTLEILLIIIAFLASVGSGVILIPLILDFCKRKGLYDIPNARKLHKNAIPRLGGISFIPSMLLAFFIAITLFDGLSNKQHIIISTWSIAFFISLVLIYIVGVIDDLIGLTAKVKFPVQIAAAMLLPLAGLRINDFYGLFGIHEIPFVISILITIFAVVYITNAINLIDGIDGLCSGLSFLALGGFLFCFTNEKLYVYSILIAGLMGVLLAYFYYNYFGVVEKNRKIFMGDSGSLSLGFILAFLSVKFAMNNPQVMPFRIDALFLPVTLLIIPVFDVTRMILVRSKHHKPLFLADKNHIHHKLIRAGMSQHQALWTIIALALGFFIVNDTLMLFLDITYILIIDIFLYIAFHYVVNHYLRRQGKPVFAENTPQ